MTDYEDQKLYSEEELLSVLYGLDLLYQSRPWYTKWYWKPYHVAINMLSVQLCGQLLNRQSAFQEVQDILENE